VGLTCTQRSAGVPALQILRKELGLTADQVLLLQRGKLIIPAQIALPALSRGLEGIAAGGPKSLSQQLGIAKSYASQIAGLLIVSLGQMIVAISGGIDLSVGSVMSLTSAMLVTLDPQLARPSSLRGERNSGLTQRELQILQLIVNGKSNKEIAAQLELSVNTVAVHRATIMDALGIHKTAELVVYAIRNGLVNIP